MLRVRPYQPGDRERWDAFVRGRPESHFGQRVAWKELTERAYGVPARYWIAEEDGRVRGVLPLFEKRGHALFSAPGGLLADAPAVAGALLEPAREFVARARLDWVELRDQRVEWPGLETSREHFTMELRLESSEEAQWKAFDAKLRNQVRKGEKSGFTMRWGPEHVADFHRVMLENLRDLGTPLRAAGYFRAALAALGDDAELLIMDVDGVPAGAMFMVRHGEACTDPWASSLRRYFARCPNHVLYWAAIRRAMVRGLTRFDFGRTQRTSGTWSFKTQWGAEPVQLYYQYALGRAQRLPTLADQKSSLELAVRVWRHLPLPLAGLLGEPAKRRFPEVL